MDNQCFIAPTIGGRFIIVLARQLDRAWSGSFWVSHNRGIPTGPSQVSNYTTREEAIQDARAAGHKVLRDGYIIHGDSITCFACGMTSHSIADVRNRYCGACCKFHEEKISLEGTVS